MDQGCFCFPDDREQSLCLHHVMRATPIDSMTLKIDFTQDQTFTVWWNAGMPRG